MTTQPPPLEAASAAPLPLPNDLPPDAPVLNDVERGYPKTQIIAEDPDRSPVGSRRGSGHDGQRSGGVGGSGPGEKKRRGKGLTEGDQDVAALPKNNLLLVMPAIGLVLFLAALDMSAYTLAMTLQTPLNGRVSDIVGRKPLLYTAILTFLVFSALCGAAKNMTWLIVARFFQGLGGGSIIGLCNILVSDIVPLHKRGVYQGWIGGTWGIAATLGPILGGLLTEKVTWRWTFYINLPTCGLAFAMLFFTLKLNPVRKLTFRELVNTFDFVGMALLMAGGALLTVGFANAADHGFDEPLAYAFIIVGVVLLIASIINCLFTKRNAVIPARMFKIRTTLFFLLGSTLHSASFLPANYLLPQLFQAVRGAGPLDSGIQLLPFAVLVAIGTIIAGQINSRLRVIRPVAWTGYALGAIGYGLFYGFFRWPFSIAVQEGIQVIAAIGIGLSLQVPMLILQAAMPLKEMASATSAWALTRSLGGSIGLAVFTAVLNTQLRKKFEAISGYGTEFEVPQSAAGYAALQSLPEGQTKTAVLRAFTDAMGTCWIIGCAFMIAALLLTLWTRSYSLNRMPGGGSPNDHDEGDRQQNHAVEDSSGEKLHGAPNLADARDSSPASRNRDRIAELHEGSGTPFSDRTAVNTPAKDQNGGTP